MGGDGSGGGAKSAETGGGVEEIPVDESLFTEEVDDPVNKCDNEGDRPEDEVPVDESLFDIENLDIDDDPSITQTHGEPVQCN